MKNTDKMYIAKLTEIGNRIEETDNIESVKQELHDLFNSVTTDYEDVTRETTYSFDEEKEMDTFAVGRDVILCKSRETDRPDYIKLQKENTIMPQAYEKEGFEDMLWEDMNDRKAFYTVIRNKVDDTYIGYCGIKNIEKEEWELAIEILKEFHRCGYGSQALRLFINSVHERTGINCFMARVDGENIASQRMCEKLGGIPSGIAEQLLHDQEYMEEYEREHRNEVTDLMREVAEKFGVAPEKLLTHVLVYRFDASAKKDINIESNTGGD